MGNIAVRADAPAAWMATGDAHVDLPPWVQQEMSAGATVTSFSVNAVRCTGQQLQALSDDAFARVLRQLPGAPARLWTFLPSITELCEDGLQRYMHMNVGRARAYQQWGRLSGAVPAGTCVGHAGTDLVVHALSCTGPVTPVENPRQRPAYRYSARFGPTAPPFARGVRVGAALWASGTAAVRGEESVCDGDLRGQWHETAANLHALRVNAQVSGAWTCMRAYVRDAADVDAVAKLGARTFPGGLNEILVAPLCRAELLLEVEGVTHE